MAALKVYNGSSWVTAVAKTYNGSAWETKMKFYDGSAWQKLYGSAVSVIVATLKTIFDTSFGGTAYAYFGVASDGNLKASTTGTTPNVSYEVWLDAGLNSQVWVQMVLVSGTFTTSAGTARLACTSNRTWGISNTSGIKQTSFDINFYDAASGGTLLDSQRVTLYAEVGGL